MNKTTTTIAVLLMIALSANLALAGGGGKGGGGGHRGGGNGGGHSGGHGGGHRSGGSQNRHHFSNNHHNFYNNHHNKHRKYYNGHRKYYNGYHRYYAPYYHGSGYARSAAPQAPIVLNNPVNIVTPPAPAPAPAKVVVKPETKVEMGDTVRITSEKIKDSADGRATMKIGRSSRRLEVVEWGEGYAIVDIPTLDDDDEKVVTIYVFNAPGKLANKVDALLIPAQAQIQSRSSQYATSRN